MRHIERLDRIRFAPDINHPHLRAEGDVMEVNPTDMPLDPMAVVVVLCDDGPREIYAYQIQQVRPNPFGGPERREQRLIAQAFRLLAYRFRNAPNIPTHLTSEQVADWIENSAIGEDEKDTAELTRLAFGETP